MIGMQELPIDLEDCLLDYLSSWDGFAHRERLLKLLSFLRPMSFESQSYLVQTVKADLIFRSRKGLAQSAKSDLCLCPVRVQDRHPRLSRQAHASLGGTRMGLHRPRTFTVSLLP